MGPGDQRDEGRIRIGAVISNDQPFLNAAAAKS